MIGLVLTGVMILVFLGSPRATVAVLLSVPLSTLVCLFITGAIGGSINTMILGGLALVFSRLIDNGVIVLENIFRHMEMGNRPATQPRKAASKSRWPCWPRPSPPPSSSSRSRFSHGVSKYIFTPLALGVVLSIFASYFFAMTVVPLYCAKFIRLHHARRTKRRPRHEAGPLPRFVTAFNENFQAMLELVRSAWPNASMQRPGFTAASFSADLRSSCSRCFPFLGPRLLPSHRSRASSSSTCTCPAARGWK